MKNIAIIGSGISGLTSAYLLSQQHKVTVFEKNDYIGGHTATIDINVKQKNIPLIRDLLFLITKLIPNF